ncbi:MAG: MarR family transcriptional regulator [Actinomycetota bacterium]|nr:MarR family transcriptional regulator [Actinomycetota bacterium]
MFHASFDDSSEAGLTQRQRVARETARTIPRVMGTLAAGFRESGEGIHPSQLRMLMMMHGGAMSPSDLAERMEVSLPTISKSLTGLERRGWVERTADVTDRRRVQLDLTGEGRTKMCESFDAGIAQLEAALSSASDEELGRIEVGLESLKTVFARSVPEHHHKGRPCRRAEKGSDQSR